MGCWTNGQTLWPVTERMLWRQENNLADGQTEDGYDRAFVPRVGYTTGEVDGHEVAVGGDDRPVFVNTRFSCIATIDERFNFRPLGHPQLRGRFQQLPATWLRALRVQGPLTWIIYQPSSASSRFAVLRENRTLARGG